MPNCSIKRTTLAAFPFWPATVQHSSNEEQLSRFCNVAGPYSLPPLIEFMIHFAVLKPKSQWPAWCCTSQLSSLHIKLASFPAISTQQGVSRKHTSVTFRSPRQVAQTSHALPIITRQQWPQFFPPKNIFLHISIIAGQEKNETILLETVHQRFIIVNRYHLATHHHFFPRSANTRDTPSTILAALHCAAILDIYFPLNLYVITADPTIRLLP